MSAKDTLWQEKHDIKRHLESLEAALVDNNLFDAGRYFAYLKTSILAYFEAAEELIK